MDGFTVLNKLGQGGQGTTLCVARKSDNQTFVCKQITCSSIAEGNNALMEAKVLQKINHPGVIKYEDLFLHETIENNYRKLVVCIVMEYCEKGDLHNAISYYRKSFGSMPEAQIVKWMHGICRALSHVHEIGILHRDLKPMNIFIDRHGNVKLGDFGLARKFQSPEDLKSRAGTPCYLAPEVLNKEVYAQPSDVWGVGCICLECMQMTFLWERKGLLAVQVMEGPVSIPPSFSNSLRTLVSRMLERNPGRRPTSRECLEQFGRMLGDGKQNPPPNPPPSSPTDRAKTKERTAARDSGGRLPNKPDNVANGVADAIEIAKAAARHAAHVAGAGLEALHKDGGTGKQREERQGKDRNEEKERAVADYEAALEKKRVKPGSNTPTLQTIMAYPLISKDGLTIYISDQDLLAGIELFVKPGMSADEIIGVALNNKGFFERYVGSQDNVEMVKGKMRKVMEDAAIPQQGKPREKKREKVARALEHLKDRTETKLKETKSAIFHPLKGFVNDMSTALQKLHKSSNDQPREGREDSKTAKGKQDWGVPAQDPHGSRAAALDLLKSMNEEPNVDDFVWVESEADWGWPVAEKFPGLSGITNEEDRKILRKHLDTAHTARKRVDDALEKLSSSPYLQKADGTRYKCLIDDKEMAGIALLEYPSGAKYVGDFKNGRPHGLGGLKLDKGGCYLGRFHSGIYDGVGHLRLSCDMEFCGNFQAGEFQGWGCLSGTKRVFTQYGMFEKGKLIPKPSVGYA